MIIFYNNQFYTIIDKRRVRVAYLVSILIYSCHPTLGFFTLYSGDLGIRNQRLNSIVKQVSDFLKHLLSKPKEKC